MIRSSGKIKKAILALLVAIAFLTSPTSATTPKKLNVVVSIAPLHSLVAGVMRDVAEPYLLIKQGSPHDYALKPSQARALQNADVVVWMGPRLEVFLISPLKSLASKADIVTLEKSKGLTTQFVHSQTSGNHKHAHKTGNEKIDPHMWLDPQNARAFVISIATALSNKDPRHKNMYWKNARQMITRLDVLTTQIQKQLTSVRQQAYLTYHDAFIYFERRFNLNYAGSVSGSDDHSPGARQLKILRNKILNGNIKCLFGEVKSRSIHVKPLIAGTPVRTQAIDALGNGLEKGPELYFTLLQNNARAFLSCLHP